MMQVWPVTAGDYEDRRVISIHTSEEKAGAYAAAHNEAVALITGFGGIRFPPYPYGDFATTWEPFVLDAEFKLPEDLAAKIAGVKLDPPQKLFEPLSPVARAFVEELGRQEPGELL